MKARLNITLEASLLETVKSFAAKKHTSISQIVEEYFKTITKKSGKKSLLDLLDELPEPGIHFPKDFDFEKEYYEEKRK